MALITCTDILNNRKTLDSMNNVILRYVQLAEETNTYYGLAKYCLQQMIKYQKWTRTEFASKVNGYIEMHSVLNSFLDQPRAKLG
jgi:SRSO17 transposase